MSTLESELVPPTSRRTGPRKCQGARKKKLRDGVSTSGRSVDALARDADCLMSTLKGRGIGSEKLFQI